MARFETLDVLGEIKLLVLDKLQVVSYKWLSRNFSISSNGAKRLLQDFVEKHGNGLEIVYTLSGWLNSNPKAYHVSLVRGIKLSEAKKEFKGNCSVQVYSVQACMPKDAAVLWSIEFTQAEELFDQPSTIDNCLRDNRFCAIANSSVKRNGIASFGSNCPKNGLGSQVFSKTNGVLQNARVQQNQAKIPAPLSTVATSVVKAASEINAQSVKPSANKETGTSKKSKLLKDEVVTATEGSLANIWGHTSTKLKPPSPALGVASMEQDSTKVDDEEQDINFRREPNGCSGRKRKVVIDFSDDEDDENLVNLTSPELPNQQLISGSSHNDVHLRTEKNITDNETIKTNELGAKEIKVDQNSSVAKKGNMVHAGINKAIDTSDAENKMNKNNVAAESSFLPKRKKVLKTRIDERGREVTEVVWEGEAADANNVSKEPSNNGTESRQPTVVKGPSIGATAPSMSNATGKTGNKKAAKGGSKDAKQGKILSFFKKI